MYVCMYMPENTVGGGPKCGWLWHRWDRLTATASLFRQRAAANCATPPTASAGKYTTPNCKLLFFLPVTVNKCEDL